MERQVTRLWRRGPQHASGGKGFGGWGRRFFEFHHVDGMIIRIKAVELERDRPVIEIGAGSLSPFSTQYHMGHETTATMECGVRVVYRAGVGPHGIVVVPIIRRTLAGLQA